MGAEELMDKDKQERLARAVEHRMDLFLGLVAADAVIKALDPSYRPPAYPAPDHLAPVVDIEAEVRRADPRLDPDSMTGDLQRAAQDRRRRDGEARRASANERSEARRAEIAAGPYRCIQTGCRREFPTEHGMTVHARRMHPGIFGAEEREEPQAEQEDALDGRVLVTGEPIDVADWQEIEHEYPPYHKLDPLPATKALECRDCPFATRRGQELVNHARDVHHRVPTEWERTPKKIKGA